MSDTPTPSPEPAWYRHQRTTCPHCGQTLDAVGTGDGSDQGTIQPGDFSVCIACASLLEYTAIGAYRLITPEEAQHYPLAQRNEWSELQRRIRWVWTQHSGDPHA